MMKVWDLHCDTLSALSHPDSTEAAHVFAANTSLHMDLERMRRGGYLMQCMAVYVDLKKNPVPLTECLRQIEIFRELLEKHSDDLTQIRTPDDIRAVKASGKIGMMLTLEEGAICMDDIRILRHLYRQGARMMTLTWNYENGLGFPNHVPDSDDAWCEVSDRGLKEKGLAFLEEMERLHMILDVSHLSDGGIRDVLRHASRPFAASHSNARHITPHTRNLTNEMIRAMGERGCLIGLNFCPSFADPTAGPMKPWKDNRMSIAGIIAHARHIIDLGGIDILALGSDFDGITGDLELNGAQDMPKLAEGFRQAGFTQNEIEKIFWRNAMRFFVENL